MVHPGIPLGVNRLELMAAPDPPGLSPGWLNFARKMQ